MYKAKPDDDQKLRDKTKVYLMSAHLKWIKAKTETDCSNDEEFALLLLDLLDTSSSKKKKLACHALFCSTEKCHSTCNMWSKLKTEMKIQSNMSDEVLLNILLNYWYKGHEDNENTSTFNKTGCAFFSVELDSNKELVITNRPLSEERRSLPTKPLNEMKIPVTSKSWGTLAACINTITNSVKLFLANKLICQISVPDYLDLTHDLVRDCLEVPDMKKYVFNTIVSLLEEIGKIPPLSIEDVPIKFVDACNAVDSGHNQEERESIECEEQLPHLNKPISSHIQNVDEVSLTKNNNEKVEELMLATDDAFIPEYGSIKTEKSLPEEDEVPNEELNAIEETQWQLTEGDEAMLEKDNKDTDWIPELEFDGSSSEEEDVKPFKDNIKDNDWFPTGEGKKKIITKDKESNANVNIEQDSEKSIADNLSFKGSYNRVKCALRCDICLRRFTSKYFLHRHELKEHKESAATVSVEELQRYRCDYKMSKCNVSCDVCQKTFKSNTLLSKHKLIEHEKSEESNANVNIVHDSQKSSFEKNVANDLPVKRRYNRVKCDLKCDICLRRFTSKYFLHRHELKEHKESATNVSVEELQNYRQDKRRLKCNVSCDVCQKTFKSNTFLSKHKLNAHEKSRDSEKCTFECDLCQNKYLTKAGLERHHKLVVHRLHEVCDVCQKTFNTKSKLYQHKMIHGGTLCPYCGKQYKAYEKHVKAQHAEEESFVTCTYLGCGKKMSKQSYPAHAKCHFKDEVCSICGKAFSRKGDVEKHVRIVHMKDKPYPCHWQNCGKAFACIATLKCHVRIHTGQKPYSCKFCSYTGRQKSIINWHMRQHHGMPTSAML